MATIPKTLFGRLKVNSSRVYLENFVRRAAASLPPKARLLDAGAGEGMYRAFFEHVDYESVDFCQVKGKDYGEITFVSDLADLPMEDERYDRVICTQVLEHPPEPKVVLGEIMRVLKPGGHLWLSTPLFFKEYEVPHDYYRYTRYGLIYLLESCGFEVKKINWLEGYFGTLAYQLETAALDLPLNPRSYGSGFLMASLAFLVKPTSLVLSMIFGRLDLRSKYDRGGLCKNYALVAVKPL